MQDALVGADRIAAVRDYEEHVRAESDGDPTHQLDLTIDPASSLLMKPGQTSLSDPAHPVASDQVLTDWETVEGIRFVRRFTVCRSGVRVAEALDVRHTINTGLKSADLAAKPPDGKPVLGTSIE